MVGVIAATLPTIVSFKFGTTMDKDGTNGSLVCIELVNINQQVVALVKCTVGIWEKS